MDSQELRKLQAPLKLKYREDPDSAIIKHKVEGHTGKNISCIINSNDAQIEVGLHPATGGDGILACSADILLQALVACTGVTLKAVATAMDIQIENGNIIAEGEIDYRGTLGVSKEVPVGFKEIRLSIDLNCNASEDQIQTIKKLTERYCVVYQSITACSNIKTSFRKI